MIRALPLLILGMFLMACHAAKPPELRVLGVHATSPHKNKIIVVQVTNPSSHSMRLTKLDYTFAADGATISQGELPLYRELPANSIVVVEVPLDTESQRPMTMYGELTAELDEIVRSFPVSAQIEAR